MLHKAIGISIILGFLFSEFLGIATGGLVSAGYMAFFMATPARIISTLVLSMVIYFLTILLQKFIIIYGRRRFMVVVLLSLIGTWLVEQVFSKYLGFIGQDVRMVGFIIPGLIANDMFKQGVVKTLAAVTILSAIIRLIILSGIL
ncbi:MAG: poly-gamma-glutamate biosynthesis protein PgsC [Spirochaetales bacterium]|nr:poly-gamma-glutamate biosynthesis protein PgsC [Spirochaetales bacterium]MBQ4281199.1 poly-gamma-glutamate biosynthesis protein PgsC [Spirochaetales bacterium]MBQ7282999.1 poly-gamma-glutamate biosynthesis protein PgsC [Spirochaetales bacterium]MCR5444042.1 poly-gamma-glutamate biosynthesis protein PgsC [Sphaerochaetaceae bacterium]